MKGRRKKAPDSFWNGDTDHLHRIRQLVKGLIVSGFMNIAFIIYICYGYLGDKSPIAYCELRPIERRKTVDDFTNAEAIRRFKLLTFDQLAAKLHNCQLVEEGYTQRDLALGCLVAYHYFDLKKALLLHPAPQQQRQLAIRSGPSEVDQITVYPCLTSDQWQSIVQFAEKERWPVTAEGLFQLLSRSEMKSEKTLVEAFYHTDEFVAADTLFNRGDVPVTKEEVIEVLLEGDWNTLQALESQQRQAQDLSPTRRQCYLLDYLVRFHSKSAGKMLLKTDRTFASKKLDDSQVLIMLGVLTEKIPESYWLAQELLISPRGNAVWQAAAMRLYQYANESIPVSFDRKQAITRFIPEDRLKEKIQCLSEPIVAVETKVLPVSIPQSSSSSILTLAPLKKEKTKDKEAIAQAILPKTVPRTIPRSQVHVVQKGDTLWKISRKYNTTVEEIRTHNHLATDNLKTGRALIIP